MNLAHPKARVRGLRELVSAVGAPTGEPPGLLERLRHTLETRLNALEEQALAPRAFTAVLPLGQIAIEERNRLLDYVRQLNDTHPPLLAAPGLRAIRLSLRVDIEPVGACHPFGALVLDCTHEGEREDVAYELFERHAELLDTLLCHCRDYPGSNVPDACVRQLLRAAEARKLAANDACAPAPARASQVELQLHDFEQELPNEADWIRRATQLSRASSRRTTRAARRRDPFAKALRGVHAKHHGLLQAKFIVRRELPLKFRHGVFQPGAEYNATMRVSNMSPTVKPDTAPDARGLAIKLEGVPADREPREWLASGEDTTTQDFLLASHPAFFVKDVRDYSVFRGILAARGRWLLPRLAVFGLRRPRELLILARSLGRGVDHPLNLAYHSMSAYAFESRVVKYLVRPIAPIATASRDTRRSKDYLRESLQRSLDPKSGQRVTLEFCLVVPESVPPSVEDARADYRADQSTIVPVATIEIEPQDTSSAERMERAEGMVFTPWHTLRVHRPLGSLSRARLAVYRESVEHRTGANRETQASFAPGPDRAIDFSLRTA